MPNDYGYGNGGWDEPREPDAASPLGRLPSQQPQRPAQQRPQAAPQPQAPQPSAPQGGADPWARWRQPGGSNDAFAQMSAWARQPQQNAPQQAAPRAPQPNVTPTAPPTKLLSWQPHEWGDRFRHSTGGRALDDALAGVRRQFEEQAGPEWHAGQARLQARREGRGRDEQEAAALEALRRMQQG